MASKRRLRRKACDGKRRYDTQDIAVQTIGKLYSMKRISGKMIPYRCQFCNGFHIGHAVKAYFKDR